MRSPTPLGWRSDGQTNSLRTSDSAAGRAVCAGRVLAMGRFTDPMVGRVSPIQRRASASARTMPAVDTQLGRRTGLLDASAYALVSADLIAIAVWTREFVVSGSEDLIFESTRSYFAFGGVIILLGCLGVAFLLRAGERHRRRVSMTCLRVSSWFLLLPLAGYGLIIVGTAGFSSFPK